VESTPSFVPKREGFSAAFAVEALTPAA